MNSDIRRAAWLLWLGSLQLVAAGGCGTESAADAVVKQQVYVDRETGTAVAAEAGLATPAVNPATARRTLMPALYCGQCQAWRAAPPLEELQRNPQARRCLKCKGPLSAEGPRPADD
jgi:hypothetical protein